MAYRVQLLPRPIVIDDEGLPVPSSHVVDIVFPQDAIETMMGRVMTIVGSGTAKIIVGEATYRGVPLC